MYAGCRVLFVMLKRTVYARLEQKWRGYFVPGGSCWWFRPRQQRYAWSRGVELFDTLILLRIRKPGFIKPRHF